jgi:hypothetical protein
LRELKRLLADAEPVLLRFVGLLGWFSLDCDVLDAVDIFQVASATALAV